MFHKMNSAHPPSVSATKEMSPSVAVLKWRTSNIAALQLIIEADNENRSFCHSDEGNLSICAHNNDKNISQENGFLIDSDIQSKQMKFESICFKQIHFSLSFVVCSAFVEKKHPSSEEDTEPLFQIRQFVFQKLVVTYIICLFKERISTET